MLRGRGSPPFPSPEGEGRQAGRWALPPGKSCGQGSWEGLFEETGLGRGAPGCPASAERISRARMPLLGELVS